MFNVEITDEAERDFEQLDRQVASRIRKRINWIAENFEQISPERLSGSLADLYKIRVGDYRVLYDILIEERTLLIQRVRHRRDIYRKKQ
jgi:mRNA interferase RelE/StbE